MGCRVGGGSGLGPLAIGKSRYKESRYRGWGAGWRGGGMGEGRRGLPARSRRKAIDMGMSAREEEHAADEHALGQECVAGQRTGQAQHTGRAI